uniref:Inactive serine protease 35 n=1 Tax=Oryzias latipes TaxID=8090 RepID=A0A3P9K023_ORYLA
MTKSGFVQSSSSGRLGQSSGSVKLSTKRAGGSGQQSAGGLGQQSAGGSGQSSSSGGSGQSSSSGGSGQSSSSGGLGQSSSSGGSGQSSAPAGRASPRAPAGQASPRAPLEQAVVRPGPPLEQEGAGVHLRLPLEQAVVRWGPPLEQEWDVEGEGDVDDPPPHGKTAPLYGKTTPLVSRSKELEILGNETLHESGPCTHTDVSLQWIKTTFTQQMTPSPFNTTYPFSIAVRISAGCSGVPVSPIHVLTAAHCIHDEGARKLGVGLLKKQNGFNHVPRSVGSRSRQQPVIRWSPIKKIHPSGVDSPVSVFSDYDYALLKLKRPVKQKHMELGVAPSSASLERIHFSKKNVVYRFCSVTKESDDLIYQHCDVQRGATGAGIYIRLRQEEGGNGRKTKWQRRVIGVFSGHQWVQVEEGKYRDYNVAVRITPLKYAQICLWIHGDSSFCQNI